MKLQDAIVSAAKKHGIDEVLVIYTSKIDMRPWIGEKARLRHPGSEPLPLERARSLVKDYGQCALVIGKDVAGFTAALKAIEDDLHKNGFYKAWAITNAQLGECADIHCHEALGIDIVATLQRYKKNVKIPLPGEYPPWGIVLLE
ncbi:MAG: hypothetical protein AABY13_01855 [Nanoarchaeota archaeon]